MAAIHAAMSAVRQRDMLAMDYLGELVNSLYG